jgi:ABC-type antimicrobial peptide transport system permease subunit
VYLAVTQNPSTFFRFAVKYEGDLSLVWPAVRERIATVDPQLVPFWSDTLGDSVAASLLFQRAPMQLLSGFALLGLFLGVIGVYGVMAHEFGSRRHEIAVRMAIGGSRWDIAGLMTRQWLLIVGSGAVVGLVAALASAQLVASLLFGTGSNDLMVTLTALAALFGAALLATVIPVRRAVRIDPAIALREE